MKKIYLSFALMLCGLFQNITAQWALTGNAPTAAQFFGTTGAQDVRFRTNNAQRMVLLGTGNVGFLGLGIATPTSFLHLNTTATGDLFRTDGPTASINRWQLFTGGTERFRLYSDAGTSPFMAMRSLSNGLRFETGGSDIRMRSFSHLHSTKCA